MKTEVKPLPDSKVLLEVIISSEEVNQYENKLYNKVTREVQIPGFRPGKAPRRIVEKVLGKEYLENLLKEDLLKEFIIKALEEKNIFPPATWKPKVQSSQFNENKEFMFNLEVEVIPEIEKIPKYEELEIEINSEDYTITEEEIEEDIERFRLQLAEYKEVERPPREGDYIEVNLKRIGTPGEEIPFKGILKKDNLPPFIRENLIKMKAGEEKEVTIEEEIEDKIIYTKRSHYNLKLLQVKEVILPELTDDFIKEKTSYSSLEDMKKGFKEIREKVLGLKKKEDIKREIFKLLSHLPLEIPRSMIESRLDYLEFINSFYFQSHGLTQEDYLKERGITREQYYKELEKKATEELRAELYINKIGEVEKLAVTDQEVEEFLKEMKGKQKISDEKKELIKFKLLKDKVLDFLSNRIKIKEKQAKVLINK